MEQRREEDHTGELGNLTASKTGSRASWIGMTVIIIVSIAVIATILYPHEPDTIVIQSEGGDADFSATSALAYADRVSRIAELTIGGVMTLALALVGFNWVTNNARVQSDREDLVNHKVDLEKKLKDRQRDLETTVASQLHGYRSMGERLTDRMDTLSSSLESLVESRANTIAKQLQHDFNQMRIDHLGAISRETGPEGYHHARTVIEPLRQGDLESALTALATALPPLMWPLEARPAHKTEADVLGDVATFFWSVLPGIKLIREALPNMSEESLKSSSWAIAHSVHYLGIFLSLAHRHTLLDDSNRTLLEESMDELRGIAQYLGSRFPSSQDQ